MLKALLNKILPEKNQQLREDSTLLSRAEYPKHYDEVQTALATLSEADRKDVAPIHVIDTDKYGEEYDWLDGSAYYQPGGFRERGDMIVLSASMVKELTPRELAAVVMHEATHDIKNHSYKDMFTAQGRKDECEADHGAAAAGYSEDYSSFLQKYSNEMSNTVDPESSHPADFKRIAALNNDDIVKAEVGSVEFSDQCEVQQDLPHMHEHGESHTHRR